VAVLVPLHQIVMLTSLALEPLPRHGLLPPTFADKLSRLYWSSKLTEVMRHANSYDEATHTMRCVASA
jgi:hypothetical protein